MRLLIIFLFFSQISFSQDYNPKRYYNPANNIDTKTQDKNKLRKLFNSVLLKRGKKDCNCPDDNKPNYRSSKLNFANTVSRGLGDVFRCKKGYGNLAMHINFSYFFYDWNDNTWGSDPWQLSDLNIGVQYFQENTSLDLWLSAPVFNDETQQYGLRAGMSFFPIGHEGVFRPYLSASFGGEVQYLYEYIYQGGIYIDNWYTEFYLLGRLHAGIQHMFKCRLVYKFDISYAAGSYFDRDSNQFPHYRPWVVFQSIGLSF